MKADLSLTVRYILTLLHSERPKLHRVLALLSTIGLRYLGTPPCISIIFVSHCFLPRSENFPKSVLLSKGGDAVV